MKPFILNRSDEGQTKSPARIVLYAFLFYMISWGVVTLLIAGAVTLYLAQWGYNPHTALMFLGDPRVMLSELGWWAVPQVLLFAPLFEECALRLGLSFRRRDVAVGLGALVAFAAACIGKLCGVEHAVWFLPLWALVGVLVWYRSAPGFWESKRASWQRAAMWTSAIVFALAHLFAMSELSWALLPYALLLCLMIFFHGCAFVYLRVNLGFWWAVGGHVLNNLMGAVVITRQLLG